MPTQVISGEKQRLAALRRYDILDTAPEVAFDSLAALAAQVCGAPTSLICFVDERRSWAKASHNSRIVEVPRGESVAARVVERGEPFVVPDALEASPDIRSLDAVVGHGVRFFAAVPLTTAEGHVIGAIGVSDTRPRDLSGAELRALQLLAEQVMAQLELRRSTRVLTRVNQRLRYEIGRRREVRTQQRTMAATLRAALEAADEILGCASLDDLLRTAVDLLRGKMGLERVGLYLCDDAVLRGTYGTDRHGQTVSEDGVSIARDSVEAHELAAFEPGRRRWQVRVTEQVEIRQGRRVSLGAGWVAVTPIWAGPERIGALYNDAALSGDPVDEARQDAVAVFCSFLGAAIQEKREVEARLAREQRYRTLAEQGSDVVTVIDSSGQMAYASPSVQHALGYEPQELVGTNVFDLVHPEDAEAVAEAFGARLAEGGHGPPPALRFRAKDGSWRYLEAIGSDPDPQSGADSLIVVARDVTSRVQAEEALRRREAILEAVGLTAEQLLRASSWEAGLGEALEALGRAAGVTQVYVCEHRHASDGTGLVVATHRWVRPGAARRASRYLRQEVPLAKVGLRRWAQLLAEGHSIQGRTQDFRIEERALLGALRVRSAAVVPVIVGDVWWGFIGFGDSAGDREWSPAEVDALRAAGSTLSAAIQRQRAEGQLARTVRDLGRSNAELEQFAYVASHDLQEPLRMVQSYLRLLQRRYEGHLDRDAQEFIGFAVDGAERMRQLVRDLLAISRIGTRGRSFEPTDTDRLLDRVLLDLGETVRESGAEVTRDALPTVLADAPQLGQVLQNLITNALKFRGAEPCRVHVGATVRNGEAVFTVRDNGIGIDPENAERVFVLFQRLHSRREYPGTGIGLTICKKIVERHGGRIWVESLPGQGATFHFTIPRPDDGE